MPYFVRVGEVHSEAERYRVGEEVPASVVDEAMVAVGAVEWREPEKPKQPEKTTASKHVSRKAVK